MFTALKTDKNKFLIVEFSKETESCLKPVKIYEFCAITKTYKETLLEGLEAKFDIDTSELKQILLTFEEASLKINELVEKRIAFLIEQEERIKQFQKTLKQELEVTRKEKSILCKKRKK